MKSDDAQGSSWVVDPVTQVELEVPFFGTAEQAIWRAAQKRADQFRTIRLFPDYSRDYPLWENFSDNYTVSAEDLGLSPSLARELRRWQQSWDEERLYVDGWSSEQRKLEWEKAGDALYTRLREELWLIAEVSPEYMRPGEPTR